MMKTLAIHGGKPVADSLIGYGHQKIDDGDIASVVNTLKSNFLTCGPATQEFENEIKQAVKANYVTAVSNGTAALHVACLAADIGPGDEVIVSPITFAASANCVLYCGGTPVFADIDEDTWNISPKSIREKISSRTKAIVAVDFGGVPVDLAEIKNICDSYNLILIEDAAHSIGSLYQGQPVGSIADITTFSFHPVKTITTGEGGAVATNSSELHEKIQLFAKHGITRDRKLMKSPTDDGWYYEQIALGYNYRISDIEAALGISQIKKLPDFATRRREIVAKYDSVFKCMPELTVQFDSSPEETTRHLYCVRFALDVLGKPRRFIYDALHAEGIGVNVHYLPVYRLPYYAGLGYDSSLCPEANSYYEEAITLPLHCDMSDEDVEKVILAVKKVIAYCKG